MGRALYAVVWIVLAGGALLGYTLVHPTGHPVSHTSLRVTYRNPSPAPLSIASIFAPGTPQLRGLDRHNLRTLIATGDVIPARSVNYRMSIYNDFRYPFHRTAGYLRSGDITLIDLESPLIAGCPVTTQGMQFCGDPRAVQGLTYAGVDVACTANNHIGNYGDAGIQETWIHLRAAGIKPCGLGTTAYVTIRGLRFAFLAYNCVGQPFDYATARTEIKDARRHAAVVVVSVHWGKEYVPDPQIAPGIADDNPRKVARWIIDSGADLIIGNHPHHVQGIELYHHRLITYAHGNFAFDQMFTVASCPGDANFLCSTREGVVGTYTFYGRRLIAVRYRPVLIYDYAQPRWANPSQAQVILAGMKRASVALQGMSAQ